jgi:hypothetical protein
MIRGLMPAALVVLAHVLPVASWAVEDMVNPYAVPLCSVIIGEMTEGKVSPERARQISLAVAQAANRHFGKVTCGDMWLYMAIIHVESNFRNNLVNYYNCRGMFQVHAPSWARKFGLKYSDLLDLDTNADCGIRVFKYYLDLYKLLVPALSAYNSDHPRAAVGYASAVLNTRKKIKKRYTQLYKRLEASKTIAANPAM